MAGDEETGVCIMRMAEGLDTGPVFLERRIPINDEDTSGTLHNKLAYLGAEALIQSLSTLGDDNLPVAQESIHVTYAHKISSDDAQIDWSANASDINRLVRAMSPAPGAFTFFGDTRIKIWETIVVDSVDTKDTPGTVIELTQDGFVVLCGEGALKITFIQKAGGRKIAASEYVGAFNLEVGHVFK
jgi:methionyl-tRNA formyltransferase